MHWGEGIRPEGIEPESFTPHWQRKKPSRTRLARKRRKSLRWRYRNLRSPFATHHLSPHGDSYESRSGRGGETRPMALVPAQRPRHTSDCEAVTQGDLRAA